MKRVYIPACILLAVTLGNAWPLEGTLPKEQTALINDGKWWFVGDGTWNVKDIVSCYNGYIIIKNRVKVGLDPKLATKTLVDFKVKEFPVLGGLEKIAEKIGAKVYAINDSFLYIASELPNGFVIPKQSAGTGKETKTATASVGATSLPAIFPYCQVGCSTVIPWSHVSQDDARKDPRPKILFVYDNDPHIETNNTAHFFETLLLEDPDSLAALKGIYYIRICADEKQMWPGNFLEPAKMPDSVKALPKGWKPAEKDAKEPTNPASWSCNKGAALYLLRPDCSLTSISWTERNPQFTAKLLIDAARPLMEAYRAKLPPEKAQPDKTQKEPPQTPKKPDPPKTKSDDEKE
jgi:hypothetical protein